MPSWSDPPGLFHRGLTQVEEGVCAFDFALFFLYVAYRNALKVQSHKTNNEETHTIQGSNYSNIKRMTDGQDSL